MLQVQELNVPISIEEVKLTITKMKTNTSPGSDGITTEYYKMSVQELAIHLVRLFNKVLEEKVVPKSWNEANIILIPKPHKHHRKAKSFRPIELLNTDYKILAVILAKRLNTVLGTPIQTGFIKGRQVKGNTRKVLNIVDHAREGQVRLVLFFADVEKAFGRME